MLPLPKLYLARFQLPVTDTLQAMTTEQAGQFAKQKLAQYPPGTKLLGVWQAGMPPPEGIGPVVVAPKPRPPTPRGGPPSGSPAAGRVLKEEAA